jgi:iron complex outermembrane receptor protein
MRLTGVVGILLVAGSVLAAQRPGGDSTQALERVTVSATRTTLSGFLTPLAVTTVENTDLRRGTGVGTDGALRHVPGVLAQSRSGATDVKIVIRGYGARGAGDRSNAGTSRGIRVLLDGFPETEPDGRTALDAIDVSLAHQLAVIRSNASAMWGNAAGGLLSVSTVPRFDVSRVNIEPMTATFGLNRISATLGGKVGETGRAWMSHSNTSLGGWRPNSSGRRQVVNVGFSAETGPQTSLTMSLNSTNNLTHVPGPLTRVEFDANPQQANAAYEARRQRRHNRVARLGVNVDHDFSADAGVSVSMFASPKSLESAERGVYRDVTQYHVGSGVSSHFSHWLDSRLATFRVGADAAYQAGASLFYNLVNGERGTTLVSNRIEGARNIGVFAQDEVPVTSRLTAVIGARYDEVLYDFATYSANPVLRAKKLFDGFSPRLGLSFSIDSQHVMYANVGGGIEVPAGNEVDPPNTAPNRLDLTTALNPFLEPIRSVSSELGVRGSGGIAGALSGSYDITVYNINISNEIIPYRGGSFYFTAAKARRQGVEVSVSAESNLGVSAQATVNYYRHRYVNYVVDSAHYGVPGATADYSGNKVVGVPTFTSSGLLGFRPRGYSWLNVELEGRQSSSFTVNDANTQSSPRYIVLDGAIGITRTLNTGATLTTRIGLENLTNARYSASAFLNPDLQPLTNAVVFLEPGMPRMFFLSVSLSRSN